MQLLCLLLIYNTALGTVLIKNTEELEGYSRSEEDRLEALINGMLFQYCWLE